MKGIKAVRPKINGERFVAFKGPGETKLKGFCDYLAPHVFVPDLVEYYAGFFFVLSPQISAPLKYELMTPSGKRVVDFLPHPWLSPDQVLNMPDLYTHRYDGVMISFDGMELRVKFDPTVEVELENEIWEVRESEGKMHRVRNRYGKIPVTIPSAIGRIRACIPASELVKCFGQLTQPVPDSLLPSRSLNQNASAKVVLITDSGKLVCIRERKIGRLDFVGGMLEPGETPLDTVVREASEELRVGGVPIELIPEDCHYLGISKEEADTVVWTTHLFLARAPDGIGRYSNVELFPINFFQDFKHSNAGRPRQVWFAHYLDWLAVTLVSLPQAQVFFYR